MSKDESVSKAIFVNLENAVVDAITFKGVVINGYTFVTSEKTVRVGFERFAKDMKVDVKAYLSPRNNALYLNEVSLAGVQTENPLKELANTFITDISENSIFLDGEEYLFSNHTVMETEPEVGMKVDAVVYVTLKGRKYINGFKPVKVIQAEKNEVEKPEKQTDKVYHNNHAIKGEIAAIAKDGKSFRIGDVWLNFANKSIVCKGVELKKGERVRVYYYASPKGGCFINKVFPTYYKKSA